MALDHTRDFLGASGQSPRDITQPALFMTRWVTHFCAPTFILLAGISAYLYGAHGRSTGQLRRFLLTRGFWLIFVELTIVGFGWNPRFASGLFFAQVIWAIGVFMIVLAGLVYLPRWMIAAISILLIAGHNLFDGVSAASLGSACSRGSRTAPLCRDIEMHGLEVLRFGEPGDASTHLENHVDEPAANPYLYLSAQIHAGLGGIARKLDPGPSADTPYEGDDAPLPAALGEAIAALRADEVLRAGFSAAFVDYYTHIKEAELARFEKEQGAQGEVTYWKQREYLDLF